MSGATAGALSQTLIYPLEVIKTRMVLRHTGQYSSGFNCVRNVFYDVAIAVADVQSVSTEYRILAKYKHETVKYIGRKGYVPLEEDTFHRWLEYFRMLALTYFLQKLLG